MWNTAVITVTAGYYGCKTPSTIPHPEQDFLTLAYVIFTICSFFSNSH
jgi:hypothetical protein